MVGAVIRERPEVGDQDDRPSRAGRISTRDGDIHRLIRHTMLPPPTDRIIAKMTVGAVLPLHRDLVQSITASSEGSMIVLGTSILTAGGDEVVMVAVGIMIPDPSTDRTLRHNCIPDPPQRPQISIGEPNQVTPTRWSKLQLRIFPNGFQSRPLSTTFSRPRDIYPGTF